MISIPINATDAEVLDVVTDWVDLLADGDFVEAQSLLIQDGAERDWPPSLVASVIGSYEFPPSVGSGEKSRVTRVRDARVVDIEPRPSVSRWNKGGRQGVIGDVHFDLPINGIWSDLTAIFSLRQLDDRIAIELYDIHVL